MQTLPLTQASHSCQHSAEYGMQALPRCSSLLLRPFITASRPLCAPVPRPQTLCQARRSSALQQLEDMAGESEREREDAHLPVVDELVWDSPLEVLQYPHPKLRAENARVGDFGPNLRRLAAEMFDIMYSDDGVGLAAPQIGINVRLMVFNAAGERGEGEELVLANPRLVSSGRKTDTLEEGCLSFFKLGLKDLILADVQRPVGIRVEAQDADGKEVSHSFSGWAARVFQHEYDHLQGTLFPDRVKKGPLREILPLLRELEADYLQRHPDAQIKRYH